MKWTESVRMPCLFVSSSPPLVFVQFTRFPHAVNNIPLDGFRADQPGGSLPTGDVSLTNLFSNKAIYSWATDDVSKKMIAICMPAQNTEALRRSLMDAAEQCVAVDFIMLEAEATFISASSTAMLTQNTLTEQACKCHGHPIDLVTPNKAKWRTQCRELLLYAGSVQCEETATRTRDQVTDGKTLPLAPGPPFPNKAKWTCPITNRQLAASDVTATAVRIGEQTIFSADFF
ncbi:uncharacterized protein [Miscanthus floridulus]|uniref:uncharacterized protein isoform X2 n=1 Tax=Miscanthus floridulus TaxID=154761 RepID=UPI003457AE1B